jgi:hypothetical protein
VRILKLCLLAIVTTAFFMTMSCKKGDTGATGATGPDSVMYSSWTTLSTTWQYAQYLGDSAYIGTVTAPQITSKVLNSGSVIGYFLLQDPLTGDSSAVNALNYATEFFTPGYIDIASSVDLTGISYRYVIIPGKISITSSDGTVKTYSSDQMNKMDYTTLTGLLNIPAKGSGSKSLQ